MTAAGETVAPMRRLFAAAGLVALAGLAAHTGCRRSSAERPLAVHAASSLQEALRAFAGGFEARHPGARVRFDFAGSQALATQIEHGARADVFASADREHAERLAREGRANAPVDFACNELVVAFPADNPAGLRDFAELPKARRIVLAAAEVPAGAYTEELLRRADRRLGSDFSRLVLSRTVSRELNVRQVLAKVSLGEADAAIVYRTDARAAGARVKTLEIPPALNVVARYSAATIKDSGHPLAQAFVDELAGAPGRDTLAAAGFIPCPAREDPAP